MDELNIRVYAPKEIINNIKDRSINEIAYMPHFRATLNLLPYLCCTFPPPPTQKRWFSICLKEV